MFVEIPPRKEGCRQLKGEVVWIEAQENTWGKRVLDCRPLTGGLMSWTEDKETAEWFASRKPDYGIQLIDQHPREARLQLMNLSYPITWTSDPEDGPVFFSSEMEEKWDLFFYTDILYFARSWTGELIFRGHVEFRNQLMLIAEAEVDGKTFSDPEFCRRLLDFLVKSHMYCWLVPAPVPAEYADQPHAMAMAAFSLYGRIAPLATTDDTIGTEDGSFLGPDSIPES